MRYITRDIAELLFRLFFSFIFIALGAEHIFSDSLIQELMPYWLPAPRLISIGCGLWLLTFGGCIAAGIHLRASAIALLFFLVLVTFAVHVPAVFVEYPELDTKHQWMWSVLQRSNLAKNLCLIGVCLQFLYHTPGKYRLKTSIS